MESMTRLDSIADRARSMVGPLMVACILAYFGFHAIQGERGILTWLQLSNQIERTAWALDASRAEERRLERRLPNGPACVPMSPPPSRPGPPFLRP